jgi:hypothetical protein
VKSWSSNRSIEAKKVNSPVQKIMHKRNRYKPDLNKMFRSFYHIGREKKPTFDKEIRMFEDPLEIK